MHEPCLYGWKEGASHYFIDDRSYATVVDEKEIDINKMKLPELRRLVRDLMAPKVPVSVIEEDKPLRSIEHPTMKPIRLIGRLLNNSSRQNETVLDLFGGSGSTIIAAEQLNRKCLIMELDPKYVDVIIDRYEKLTGIKAEKIN